MFNYDKPWKLGSDLCETDKLYVLGAYVYRYTGDHKPAWASKEWKNGIPYPLQFKDDADWLAHTKFQMTKKGELNHQTRECHSIPTWPNNPELRSPLQRAAKSV